MKKKTLVNPKAFDAHHLLWEKRMYSHGYARALREHPWLRIYIPRDTLHRWIHHNMRCIPVPDGKDARKCFELLMRMERAGELDYKADILERLDFLIEHLTSEATVEGLKQQRNLITLYREQK